MNDDWNDIDFSSFQANLSKGRTRDHATIRQRQERRAPRDNAFEPATSKEILQPLTNLQRASEETKLRNPSSAHKTRVASTYRSRDLSSSETDLKSDRVSEWSSGTSKSADAQAFYPKQLSSREKLSQYAERSADVVSNRLEGLSEPAVTGRVDGPQFPTRTTEGVQPRRFLPAKQRNGPAIANRTGHPKEADDDLLGLAIPAGRKLTLSKKLTQRTRVPTGIDSDSESWSEFCLRGNDNEQRKLQSSRNSTGSSSLSMSLSSAVASDDEFDGVELPVNLSELRHRLQMTNDRRAAGDTIRMVARPREEDPSEGLVLDANAFFKLPTLNHENLKRVFTKKPTDSQSPDSHRTLRPSRLPIPGARQSPSSRDSTPSKVSFLNTAKLQNYEASHTIQYKRSNSNLNLRFDSTFTDKEAATLASNARSASRPTRSAQLRPAFVPGGSAGVSSHHVSALSARTDRVDPRPKTLTSRDLQSTIRRRATASEALKLEASRHLARTHVRAKTYGEGHELDAFEDLATNDGLEGRFFSRGKPKPSSLSRTRPEVKDLTKYQDRPARKTLPKSSSPSAALRELRQPGAAAARTRNTGNGTPEIKKSKKRKSNMPGLISGINTTPIARTEKNMSYNPVTFRWEGNEDEEMHRFDSVTSISRPALITNANAVTQRTVQVVNGMVFDPDQMCWVKLADEDSEHDPFEGLDDLADSPTSRQPSSGHASSGQSYTGAFAVGEEFDAGPLFIRRQREEEVRWRRWTNNWIRTPARGSDRAYLREIYDLLMDD